MNYFCRVKKLGLIAVCALGFSGCANVGQIADAGVNISQAMGYSPEQLNNGIKEALVLSVTRASDALSVNGAYGNNAAARITLPPQVQNITQNLRKFGMGGYIDNIEKLMNKGAEQAAQEAKPLLIAAVKSMSVTDAIGIVRGGNTAATTYFRGQTETEIRNRYQTIMQAQLNQLGFYGDYKQLLSAYKLAPIANKPDLDLENRAINLGLDTLFKEIAQEEQKIRANPVEKGSVLIGAVFGGR